MSLQVSMQRVFKDYDKRKNYKALFNDYKKGVTKEALETAMLEQLKEHTWSELMQNDKKYEIITDTYNELLDYEDLIPTQADADALWYYLAKIYDNTLSHLLSQYKKALKLEQEEAEEQEEEQEEAEESLTTPTMQEVIEALKIVFGGLLVIACIIFAPLLLIGFIIIEVLKNTK